jgi:hypothetical protein
MRTIHRLFFTSLVSFSLLAEGFNTCTIPQSELVNRSGVERPAGAAWDKACIAVLPPNCRDFNVGHRPCAYRSCVVSNRLRSCPNGDLPAFTAAEIQPYLAKPVRPFTKEEFAKMNALIDAAAKEMAAKWTDNGRVPLSPAAQVVIQNLSCQMAAFANPDVRCVPR